MAIGSNDKLLAIFVKSIEDMKEILLGLFFNY